MKQPLHIRLIREFIEAKDGRSFEEVKSYADSIGASQESLEEAVYEVSEDKVDFVPSKHSLGNFKKKFNLGIIKNNLKNKRLSSALAVVVSLIILGVATFNSIRSQSPKATRIVKHLPSVQEKVEAPEFFGVGKAYAHQDEIDPVKVFSYPSSGVTLKFSGTPKKDTLGFFPYWMLEIEDKVNLTGITQVALFGLTSDGKGNIVIQNPDGTSDPGFSMWNDKKLDDFIKRARRQQIKIFITIKIFNNTDIETLALSNESQKQLIANALELVKMKSLDGIVLDFEYVGSTTDDVTQGYSRFVGNLNAELKRENEKAKLYVCTYLVGAVAPGFADIQRLGLNSDKLVVMGYDVHTPNGGPGPVAPMHGNIDIVGSIEGYLSKVDKEKIMLAVPYYGYDWAAENPDKSTSGGVAYAEIQANSKNSKIIWDEVSQTPYYTYRDGLGISRVLHFENARSLGIKYDYVNSKDLGGVAIWALGYDGLSEELGQLLLEKFAQ